MGGLEDVGGVPCSSISLTEHRVMRGHGDGERYRGWRVEKDEEERRTVGEIEELVDDALVGVVDTFRGEDEGDETTVARDCDGSRSARTGRQETDWKPNILG